MPDFPAFLASREVVLDGGFATLLESHGHDLRDALWSARLLRDDPPAVVRAHAEFFAAGADVAITASYHASYAGFASKGFSREETARLLKLSVELAREAQPKDRETFVAASVGPYAVVLADGSEYTGDYKSTADGEIRKEQAARIATLCEAKPDLLAIETIPNGREAAVLGEILEGVEVPAWVTFACKDGKHISDGTPLADAIRAVTARKPKCLVAVGINCTPPQHVSSLLDEARSATDLPLVVYANWGRVWDGTTYEWHGAGVEGFSRTLLEEWKRKGARAIGGCCGIGVDGIRDVRNWADAA
ncbi:homocysteine methyltransferase [Hyaloraphidium curvatum]|nr:homocysteine methyltransferase [Hyaloraphidium curvatum]